MIDTIIIIAMCLGFIIGLWTVGCLVIKAMFKIADKIFGF